MRKNSKNIKKYYPHLIVLGVVTVVLTVLGSTVGGNLAGYLNLSKLKTTPNSVDSLSSINKQNFEVRLIKKNITRAEVANTIVHQVLKVNPGTTYTNNPCASDLGNKYVNEVCYLKDQGIMNLIKNADDTTNGIFNPNDPMNRAEGAKIMVLALKLLDKYSVEDINCYKDVPTAAWFHSYVCTLLKANVSDVVATGFFNPANYLTNIELNTWISKAKTANLVQ